MAESAPKNTRLKLQSSGFFVLRTPLLPIEELTGWSQGLHAAQSLSSNNSVEFESAWNQDVSLLRSRLRELVSRPEICQALYIASPSLETSMKYWLEDPNSKKGLQAERSLVRYFARMAGRPMPFGIFAGSSVGIIREASGSTTALELGARSSYRGDCRLDMDYLTSLTQNLRNDEAIIRQLKYWRNSSLRKVGSHWHYVESRMADEKRSHHLVRLEADDYLEAAIDISSEGADFNQLVHAVMRQSPDGAITEEEASGFVLDLIRNEVLVSQLLPSITGPQPLDDVIDVLQEVPSASAATNTLRSVRDKMVRLSEKSLGASPQEYREIESELKALPAKVDPARLFQVDMAKPAADIALSADVVEEIVQSGEILARVGLSGEPPELRQFKDSFLARYEHAFVPLLEVMDEEIGIGFGAQPADTSPLLKGLDLGRSHTGRADFGSNLLQKMTAGKEFQLELNIDLADLPPFENPHVPLPPALFLHVALVAPSIKDVNDGNYKIFSRGWAGPSGARLFGRFCHWDSQLNEFVKHHLRQEEATEPDAIFAEVVHFPEGRIGNVLCRPVLRDYEIVYLGKSGAPSDRQLPVSDLLVSVDQANRIRIYSRRLGCRIVPRLTNAHGFSYAKLSPVYRFLCNMQHENNALPGFSWGSAESFDFLPRLRIGRTILSPARWMLRKDEIKKVTAAKAHLAFKLVRELCERRHIPRWILLVQTDQNLPFDLENPLSVDSFLHVLKRTEEAKLEEMNLGPEELCATGPEGHFFHELLVPFIHHAPAQRQKEEPITYSPRPLVLVTENEDRAARLFPPGESWLYYKVYGGISTLDDLLTSVVPGIVRTALDRHLASRWFFVRYADPENHLRIRFDTRSEFCLQELFSILNGTFNPLLKSGRIWKVQIDTYQREMERYGGLAGMFLSEDVFHADSDEVLHLLQVLRDYDDQNLRWRLALLGTHDYFRSFDISPIERYRLAQQGREMFGREFGLQNHSKRQLGDKFRVERKQLEAILNGHENNALLDLARPALENRYSRLRTIADQFRVLVKTRELQVPLEHLIGSFVHMHINRLLRSNQRAHEMVIYDFLCELYEKESAREKIRQDKVAAIA